MYVGRTLTTTTRKGDRQPELPELPAQETTNNLPIHQAGRTWTQDTGFLPTHLPQPPIFVASGKGKVSFFFLQSFLARTHGHLEMSAGSTWEESNLFIPQASSLFSPASHPGWGPLGNFPFYSPLPHQTPLRFPPPKEAAEEQSKPDESATGETGGEQQKKKKKS